MEEITKALGPWPLLQFVFGVVVLGLGIWSIMRGLRGKEEKPFQSLEDKRAEWAVMEQIKNIEENSFKLVDGQRQLTDAINRLTSVLYNRQGFNP